MVQRKFEAAQPTPADRADNKSLALTIQLLQKESAPYWDERNALERDNAALERQNGRLLMQLRNERISAKERLYEV